jgi:chlorite dismutase
MSAMAEPTAPLHVSFVGGGSGRWAITALRAVIGEPLPAVDRLSVWENRAPPCAGAWTLSGVVSHLRYTTAEEAEALKLRQAPLGRADATCAALIPIRKSAAWWDLPQDARRAIYQERSRHTTIGLEYLPAVARRLHHSRDLGEPFDFLTWFEYAPKDADSFEELVARLRRSEEWRFIEREVDIRLQRDA